MKRDQDPIIKIAGVALFLLLMAATCLYDTVYPCQKWETHTIQVETCHTWAGTRRCTVGPEVVQECLSRDVEK